MYENKVLYCADYAIDGCNPPLELWREGWEKQQRQRPEW